MIWMRVKKQICRQGLRPKRGSIFYSPSYSMIYTGRKRAVADELADGLRKSVEKSG